MSRSWPFAAKPSSLLRRLGAIVYDTLLVWALMFLVTLPFVGQLGGDAVEPGANPWLTVCLAIVIYAFFVGFWIRSGRTLGMQSWGLRVELPNGQPPGLGAASLRFVTAILSWLPLGLGFLWQLWDKEKLTWHDRLSGTRLRHYPKAK